MLSGRTRPSVAGALTVGDPAGTPHPEDDLTTHAADGTTTEERGWFAPASIAALVGFLLATAAAAYAGIRWQGDDPGAYYRSLPLPGFAPSADVFGPVWTGLYVLIAIAAWIVWRRWGWSGSKGALNLWVLQLLLNAAWTPVFFGMEDPLLGLIVILLLLIAVVATINAFWQRSRLAAMLMVPYGLWVAFATLLNGVIWWSMS